MDGIRHGSGMRNDNNGILVAIESPVTTDMFDLADWMVTTSFSRSVRKHIKHTVCPTIDNITTILHLETYEGCPSSAEPPSRAVIYSTGTTHHPTFIG